jgi:hypothetical protein
MDIADAMDMVNKMVNPEFGIRNPHRASSKFCDDPLEGFSRFRPSSRLCSPLQIPRR